MLQNFKNVVLFFKLVSFFLLKKKFKAQLLIPFFSKWFGAGSHEFFPEIFFSRNWQKHIWKDNLTSQINNRTVEWSLGYMLQHFSLQLSAPQEGPPAPPPSHGLGEMVPLLCLMAAVFVFFVVMSICFAAHAVKMNANVHKYERWVYALFLLSILLSLINLCRLRIDN